MHTSLTSLSKSSTAFQKLLLTVILFTTVSFNAYSHGTQVAYCITNQGKIRVYIEHWHGNISPGNVTNALVSIDVTDTSTGMTTNQQQVPDGVVWDTTKDNLPDCKGPLTILSSCPGRADVYNDWVYWEFTPPACFVNLIVTVQEVIGSQSFYFDEACAQLYPTSLTDNFIDCVPPTIECPSAVTENVNATGCEAVIPSGLEPTVLFDDCTPLEDLVSTYDITGALTASGNGYANGLSFPKGTSTVTYSVTDNTNKTSTCSFTVTVEDNAGPSLTCPADLTIECSQSGKGAIILDWLNSATATDLCGILSIDNNYDPNGFSNPPKGSQIVTFTATDNCGNASTCMATITIVDTTDPVITCPSDITIECGDPNNDAIIANWLDNATANDACDLDVDIANNYSDGNFTGGCDGPNGIRTVRFTATDCAGNTSTCEATITRDDTTPPTFLIQPTDITVGCINSAGNTAELNAWLASNGGGIASDDCDPTVTWSRVAGPTVDLCGYTFSRDYTFTITDNCGNTATAVATYTVEDTTPPVINLVWEMLTQTCSANNETNLANYLEQNKRATDACSPAAEVSIDWVVMSDQESCGGTIHRTYLYTATDACGNTSTDIFEYKTTDVAVPTWANIPGTLILECGDPDNATIITQWIEDVENSMFDACGGEIMITNNWDGSLTAGCNQNTVIVWTVTDDCGNTRTLSRTIAVRDTTNPAFVACPDDFTVNVDVDECGSNVTFPTPVGFDQCTPQNELEIVQINGPASGSTFPVGTTYVRFRLRDGCNRQDLCDFFITVVDSDEPSISCPSNVEACTLPNQCTWRSDNSVLPITNENCPAQTVQVEITGATVLSRRTGNASNRIFNVGTSTVCYYITDGAGNESECCFDVIITDCQDPVITCPADITNAACGTAPPATFTATATDNCSAAGNVTISSMLYNTISGCGDSETQVFQFTATDEAGNTSQCFANFTTIDNTNPTITTQAINGASDCASADIDLLDWLNNNGGAVANDACGTVTWSYDFVGGAATGCSGAPSVNVTFTATDECGNTATTAAAFNVDDTEVPTISCPSDITLECGDVLNDAVIELWLGLATGEDNCSEVSITNDYPANAMLDCDGSITVTFIATDDCGNDAECEAMISMQDNTAPAFTVLPADVTLECGDSGNAAFITAYTNSIGNAVFSDQCTPNADLTVDVDGVGNDPQCGNAEILEYQVIITDECDNDVTATWFIHIEDTTPPELTVPADMDFACDGSGNTADINAWLAGATATDDCGTATVESVLFNSLNACGNFENQSYLFTATDECGNVSTDIAMITISDTQDPVIACPDDITLSCGANNNSALVTAWLASVTATDVCSDISVTNNYTGLFPANCGGTLAVIFIATDDCGNTSSCMADIIMDDVISPDFENCPDDLTINVDVSNCDSNPIFSTPSAIDNCGVSVAQNTGPASGTPFPVGTTTVGFIATDECGNTATCEFDITVVDSADPLILCSQDLYERCITDGTCMLEIDGIEPILGMENCPGFTITYNITGATTASGTDDASGTSFNIGISEVCYTLTDAASNSSTCCFEIQVIDCTPPTVTCPIDLTVTCNGSGNMTDLNTWLATASATDACSTPVTFENKVYNTISGCGETYAVVYEFTGTDAAGNTAICYAQFTIEDITNPIIDTEAEDLTVECDGANNSNDIQSWLNSFAGAEASDGCGEISFSHNFSGDLSDGCAATGSITVIFTATDDCGNTATTDAIFTIEDTTDPTINCPQSITLQCGDNANDAIINNWLATASANDVCGDVSFTNDFATSFDEMCGETGTYTVTFTATDDCGNNTTCQGVITVEDNTLPAFDQAPQDITIACADPNYTVLYNAWITSNGQGIASDNCGEVSWSHIVLDLIPSCGDAGTLPHVWTITDDCGNISTAVANVITEDNVIPEIVVPTVLTVECDGAGNQSDLDTWLMTIAGSDDCGEVTTGFILNNTISECGGGSEANYLFTVTDACGNTATASSSFTIEDTTVPTIICPATLALECGAIGNDQSINAWLVSATASDICSEASISNDYNGTLPADCNGSVMVTFTATDDCGNTATCQASITMDDTTDPVFENCPDDLTINVDVDVCGSNPIFSTPIATDNCTVTVAQTAGLSSGSTFPVGVTAIQFTATDGCGNTVVCDFNITVIDSDVPQIFCPSSTITQCTDTGFCTWTSDDAVVPSTSFENCDDYTIEYTITGATSATGSDSAAGEVFNLGLSTVCYTITDDSDNESTCCFDVLIKDCEAPMLVCPNDLIVECAATNDTQKSTWLNTTVSSDNCDLAATITFELFNSGSQCGGGYTEQYLITATDAAGNATTCIRTFTVEDNIAPVITTSEPNVTVECDGNNNIDRLISWLANNGNIDDSDVSEFCSAYEWNNNFDQVVFTNNTPCSDDIGFYEVMFWVVDDCGNISNRITKQFIIEDTNDPIIVVPDNLTLQCDNPLNDAIISSWLLDVTASDTCDDDVVITNTSNVVDQCGNTSTTTYTFTATDACGNTDQGTAIIVIVDTEVPTIITPASDLLLECAGADNDDAIDDWEDNFGGAEATDNCSDEDLDWDILSEVSTAGCGDIETVTYVFVVEDNCGNTSTTSAQVIITDNIDPELTLPENQIEECGAIVVNTTDWINEATATDECGDVTIDATLVNTISDCGGTYTEIYLFTATDACGNTSTGLANYEITDDTDPAITCPENLILECGDEENDTNIQAWLNSAISVDANNCSTTQITHDYTGGYPDPFTCNGGTGIVVTFTSTDDCGNSSTCSANILMDDTQVPYFVNCPSNLIVNVDVDLCATNVVYSTPVALDNCDEMVSVVRTIGIPSGAEFPLGPTQITFEATDDCGNVSTCSFQITVVDSDTPSIDCPSNDVEKCTDVGNCTWLSDDDVDPLYNDNCSDITITYSITGATTVNSLPIGVNIISEDAVVFEIGSSEVCYTITDGSGNTGSCCFEVVISDCEKPAIFCSNDTDVACGSEDISGWFDGIAATATDNCNTNAELAVDTLLINNISSCGNTFDKTYLFTVTDEAGNTSTCIATYETDDEVAPIIDTEAMDLTIECTGGNQSIELQAWLNTNAGAEASDVCSGPVSWTNDFTSGLTPSCGDNGSIIVVFTATDDCGNTSTTDATFTIEDTTPPTLDLPENITLECSDTFNDELIAGWLADATGEDICEGTLVVTNDYATAVPTNLCGETGVTTVTFTITDACDNVTTDTRTITIEDTTSPVIDVAASDLILECADGGNDAAIAVFESTFGGASASDTCSDEDLVWSILSETETIGCGTNTTTLYVFQVEDNCGNTSTTSASVITEDTTDPELTLPENQVEECGNIIVSLEDWRAEATATDECGDVSITSVLWNTISGCGNTDTEEYLFTATDACGNQSTGIATYATEDTSTPTIVCPADLILECGNLNNDQMINVWLESATATDEFGCNDVEISYTYPGALPAVDCTGAAGITITFTATDACGNTDACTAMIIMNDTTIPVFQTCPNDLTVNVDVDQCSNNVVYSTPTAFDNCDDDLTITQTAGPASGTEFPLGTSTVTFEVEDNCGNTSECSFDITVVDTDTPSIDCPSNDVVVCNDDDTCTWTTDEKTNPIFNDNCPGLIVTYEITGATTISSVATGVNTVAGDNVVLNLGTSEICYTITDPTNNTASCCFNVIVEDCDAPTITCNDQLDIACGSEDVSAWFEGIKATITDNCSDAADMQVDTLLLTDFSSCGGTFEKVYLYTVTDEAGNTATCTASYETDDLVVPVIDTEASDLTLECNDGNQSTALQAWLNSNAGAAASDICSGPITWTNDFTNDLITSCGTNGAALVTFTATDECGNTSTTTATFTIEDTTSPALALPADITLECADGINATVIENWLNTASAEDTCEGTLPVTHDFATAVQTDECGLTGVTTIVFTVTDACGNSSTDTRTITIEDNTDPIVTIEPTNLNLECAAATNDADIATWEANFGGSQASDTCSDEDLVWIILSEMPIGNCGDSESTFYVFQVTDNCGNTATSSASVIISDNTDPILTVPTDLIVECNNADVSVTEWLATATATDDCGDVTITHYLNNTISGCGSTNTEVYIFTATDACGNQMTGTANYGFEDTTNPEIVCPNDLVLNCGNPSNDLIILEWLNSATASDPNNCSDITITYTDPGSLPAIDCSGGGGAVITWTATDDCGNVSTCDAMIIVEDAEPPTFVNCPTDLTINVDVDACSSNPIFSTPAADDNCSVTVMQVANANGEILASGTAFPLGTTEVVFMATDICGNTAICTFDITVEDSDVPIVLCPSNTIEASTDPGVCTWTSDDQVATAFSVENCPDQTLVYEITGATMASGSDNAAGEIFELGISTVCYTLTDASGNESMCCFDVLITDDESPMMTCPPDITLSTSDDMTDDCLSEFFWADPVISDNCSIVDATLELAIQSPTGVLISANEVTPQGAEYGLFELGTTTLTYVLTDENGNSTSCEWTVTVVDDEVPMITCPVDMTFEINDDCKYTETTDLLDPVILDNCGLGLLAHDYIFAPSSYTLAGASFEIGMTTITYVVFDEAGNSSTCDFTITIEDTEAPEFVNCPQDTLVVGNDVDQCSAFVNFSDPIAMDECGVSVEQTAGPDSGDELAPGFYTVTYVATDNNGNTTICEFVIHVQDTQMPIILCPSNDVVVDTDLGVCTWTSPAGSLTSTTALTNCPYDITWTVTNPDGSMTEGDDDVSGYVFQLGTSMICYDVIEQEDPDNNGFLSDQCCFNVIVEDNEEPIVSCQDDVVINTSAGGMGDCFANYEWNHPTPTDNCGIAMIFVIVTDATGVITGPLDVTAGDNMIFDFPIGVSTIEYDIEDENGNATSCQFTVTVEDDEVPMIECVDDIVVDVDENCQHVILDDVLDPTFSDNCNINLSYHDYIFAPNSSTLAGAAFELGITEITWTVVDDFGNSSTCSHVVTTEDNTAPTFANCPTDLTINVDVDACAANPIFSTPAAEDNCSVTVVQVANANGELLASGSTFPIGTTEVVFVATDMSGNSTICSFNITVEDTDIPIVLCPSNTIAASTDEGVCTWTSDDQVATAFSVENCPDHTLVYEITGTTMATGIDNAAGEIFELGLSTVCYTLTDASGNESMCCFDVLVTDDEMPMMTCPADVTISTSDVTVGDCLSEYDWTHPTITDNCSIVDGTLELAMQSPTGVLTSPSEVVSGAVVNAEFELGTTTLTYVLTDANGNITTCEWTVTVEDDEVPMITCPIDMTFEINDDCQYTETTDLLDPVISDNCELDLLAHDYIFAPSSNTLAGASFEIGTTTVTYVVYDETGNSSTCDFNITVEDNEAPEFVNCPQDTLVVGSEVDQCSAFVNFSDPIAMDECGVSVEQTAGPDSGDELAPGFYTVTYVATDNNGNTTICEFVIHVQDTQMPLVLCPSNDVVVDTDLGVCTWTSPAESLTATTALTNCPFDLTWTVTNPDGSVTEGDEDVSGYTFTLGTSVVCYDVIEQEDPDNNGFMSDQCCFNVIVEDNEKPLVTCQDDVIINTSAGGTGDCLANYEWTHPTPTDNCGIAMIVVTVSDAAGTITGPLDVIGGEAMMYDFPLGVSTIVYDITDENGNTSSCLFTVTVEDDEVPMIECVEDVVESVDDNCQYVVVDDSLDPTFSDNCNIDLSYHDYIFAPNSGTLAGAKFEFGVTEIIWTVIDDFGNSSTCMHVITTEDNAAPVITNCPLNSIVQDTDSGQCDAIVNFANIAAEDNCDALATIEYMLTGELTQAWTEGQASGITYPVGITSVTYRATDENGNVSEVCEFDIEIVDNIDPVAVCQDIEVGVDFNCMATITPDDINAGSSDNCSIGSLLISSNGVDFEEELTFMTEDLSDPFVVVTLQVTDLYGNVSICQSTVFIVDELDPMVICQDDIIVQTEPGVCYGIVPNVVPPIDTTDNCMGIANVRQEPLPGLLFGSEVGDSMFVTVIVEDEAGNMDSCQVKLVIEDTELPQFTNCPRPPVVVAAETDLCSAAANFSVPTGTDNCGEVTITRIDDGDLDSGDWFPIGTTILEYQIEDGSGNKDTCHIKVIVNDLQPPTLECPDDVVQVNDPGECGAIVKDIDPENVTDNCPEELTVTFAVDWEGTRDNGGVIEASGEFFQVGNNVVTYCVEDRPTILISEVTHSIGADVGTNAIPSFIPAGDDEDYIEITNVGPSSVDVSCLVIEKLSGSTGGVGTLTLPFNTIIPTGGVMVIHVGPGIDSPLDLYFNMDVGGSNPGDLAGYALMYGECVIDVVGLNGFTAAGTGTLQTITPSDWTGAIDTDAGTAGVYRPFTFDGNNNLDWAVISDDNPGTIAKVNPDFDVYPETGLMTSLQSKCGTKVCCSFTVDIFDTEPPSITCPSDMILNTSDNGTGDCTSSTSWKHPDIEDNCSIASYCMTISSPDGMEEENCAVTPGDTFISSFEVGETVVMYEVVDQAGNRSTCSFTITVLDDEDPTFTCPGDLFIQLGQGQCFVNVFNQINLFEADNCGDMTMVSNPDMDGQFMEGDNVVTIVITDGAGNEGVCSFMITVAAYMPTNTEMACQGTVNISLDADCEAVITADMILTSMDIGCIDDIEVSISETHGGAPIPTSPMVTSEYLNETLIVTLFNPTTGNSCWGTILIEDKLNPVIDCPIDMTVSCATDLEPASLGAPELMSCEESTTMIFTDEIIDNGVCGVPRAVHTRTWIVTDESGNSSTCEHTITVERLNTGDITFPENYDDIANPSFDCNAVAEDPLLIHPMNTGQPMIDGQTVVESSYCPLSINMEDEAFQICNGSYDILRTFRVYDPCLPVDKSGPNPNPFHYIQVIKVRDNTVPDVVCPASLVVSVDGNSCSADIDFPAIEIDEACGTVDVQLITPFGSLTTNGGVIPNIAIGTFSARYVVTDGCGNQTECSIDVEVLDAIEPIMVCNPDVVVSLNSAGIAEVYAEAFDQGTTDNCTLDRLEVRRMTTLCGIDADLEFGMTVTFCCADVGVPVMVQLRAYDKVGNFNECMVEVLIDDKEDAEITCPADITIDCGDDFMDLNVTGSATFTDNCTGNLTTADFTDDPFIDQCGSGFVLRTWSVGTVTCVQRIDLVDPEPFVINDTTCDNDDPNDGVIWPCDVEVESCSVIQDPSMAGEPILFDDNCTMVAMDYDDQIFTFSDNACFKIIRTWEVIDWCTYNGSSGAGRYTYDQVIKIINSMDPEFTSCEAVEACTSNNSCEATVTATVSGSDDCTAEIDLNYSYQLDINNDGSFNLNGSGNSVTQTLAIGTHSILWTITDGCGNVNSCTQLINVNDCKPPTVACINGLSTSLDAGTGSIEIWAVDFNASSTDNCTATEDLIYSFSTDVNNTFATFTCDDLPNGIEQEIQVQMWVTDAYGNQSFCTTTIVVQDVHDDCIDVMLTEAEIAGRIMTETQIGVNQVEISVENMDTGVPYDEMSDTLGNYTFPDPMPAQFEYTIKPEKNIDHKNGITALDLITIKKHLLQVDTLDSPYKLIAADINNSQSVTAIDLIQLQKLLLGVFDEFPNNTSWRFVNQDFEFPIATDPWPFEESRNIDPLMTNQMHEDFIGVKIGDVNGSADPTNVTGKVTERSAVTLYTDDLLLEENKTVEIPLYANEKLDINALQFTLKADADLIDVLEIKSDVLTLDVNDQASITDQLTTMLWYDHKGITHTGKEAILTVVLKAKANVLLSDALQLNSDVTAAALFTTEEEEYNVRLEIVENNSNFAVAQNVPNPFKEETAIMITVPQPGPVVIRVYNVLGEQLMEHKEDVEKSFMHSLLSDQLGGVAGMYLYEVSYQNEVIQKNVILIN